MKHCRPCDTTKPLDEFYVNRRSKDGKSSWCKDCHTIRRRANDAAHPQRQKDAAKRSYARNRDRRRWLNRVAHLRRTFGISNDDYQRILAEQGGGCAICGATHEPSRRLAVDHDHNTGAVRGILCDKCNRGIGAFRDNRSLLLAALAYLDAPGVKIEITEMR